MAKRKRSRGPKATARARGERLPTISIRPQTRTALRDFANERGVSMVEALDRLVIAHRAAEEFRFLHAAGMLYQQTEAMRHLRLVQQETGEFAEIDQKEIRRSAADMNERFFNWLCDQRDKGVIDWAMSPTNFWMHGLIWADGSECDLFELDTRFLSKLHADAQAAADQAQKQLAAIEESQDMSGKVRREPLIAPSASDEAN